MNKMIKIETLKEALNIYEHEADKGLWNYINGIVSQAESEKNVNLDPVLTGFYMREKVVGDKPTISEYVEIFNSLLSNKFLITRTVNGKVEYELVNSDKMTDDDRRKLPKGVWIKHDGKSVPVVEGMKWNLSIDTDTSPKQKTFTLRSIQSWTNEFLHISSRGKVLEFKILGE